MSGAPTRGEKTAEGEVWYCPRRGDPTLALGGMLVNKQFLRRRTRSRAMSRSRGTPIRRCAVVTLYLSGTP
jgi:hypothetical protein